MIQSEAEQVLTSEEVASGNDGCCRVLKTVINELQTMSRLLDTVQSFRQVPAAPSTPLNVIDLSELLTDVVERSVSLAQRRSVRLQLQYPDTIDCRVQGDYPELHRLFFIVFDNAIKYTDRGGSVCTRIEAEGHWLKTVISDTGPGMADEELSRAFERYFRGSRARKLYSEGAGLGLSMARAIVEAHNGKIDLRSSIAAGTTVFLYFQSYNSKN